MPVGFTFYRRGLATGSAKHGGLRDKRKRRAADKRARGARRRSR